MTPLFRHRRLIGAALAIIALVTLMSLTSRERQRITRLEEVLIEMIAPVQRGVTLVATWTVDTVQAVGDWRELRTEVARLQAELDQYRLMEHQFEEMFSENRRLLRLLDLTDQMPVPVTAARVIGRNPDNWFTTLVVDRGYNQGVQRDMVAITDQGVVGRVIRVTPRTATILLITDPDSGIGAVVRRSRDPGIVIGRIGDGQSVRMRFFTREADVLEGDIVVTSGVGSLYPQGLVIGTVSSVTQGEHQLMAQAEVRPQANLRQLEEVLIVTVAGDDLDLSPVEVDIEPWEIPGVVP